MIQIVDYLEWFVIAIPLLGALTNWLAGKRLGHRTQNWIACGAVAGTLLAMLPLFFGQAIEPGLVGRSKALPWITIWSGDTFIQGTFRLRIDALSMLMALTTTIISLFIHLSAVKKLAEDEARHLTLALYNGTLAALLVFEFADNLLILLLGWSAVGWATWALCHRAQPFPALALLSDLMMLLAAAFASQAFASLSIDDILLQTPLVTSTVPIGQVLPILVILVIISVFFRTAQFPFHQWLSGETKATPSVDVWHYALTTIPTGLLLAARIYPLMAQVAFAAPILSWWGTTSALLMALVALAQPDARHATRYVAIAQGGLLLLALGQATILPALAFLPAFMLLQAIVFLAQKNASASTRWAFGFAVAALAGFPLLPGFFFMAHLLALTFANVGLWIWTVLAILGSSAAAFRTIRLWQQDSHPARADTSNRLFVPMAIGGVLFGILSLTSPPLLPLFLESSFGPFDPISITWFLVATAVIGGGAWLGYWLGSKPKMLLFRPLSQIIHTHRLRAAMARPLLAAGTLIVTWERRLADWVWGGLTRWVLRAGDESR
ncbi:MAG: hypothetical protein JXA89_24465 [Anaerolineae bacterium]|nr:hypothetical protein [Anaerolineae bacterium]